jgi:serine/threonine protein kinase
MTDDRWKKVEDLFEEVVELPPADREAFLHSNCHDAKIRDEVASLLAHDAKTSDCFLESTSRTPPILFEGPSNDQLIGQTLSGCKVTRVLGVGGMGVVYEAEQLNPPRTVAIKILQRLPWSRDARRRFDFETKILARLCHPHIAQVYGVGVHEEQPFFVMEYVRDAVSIIQFSDDAQLSTKQRLQLVLQVCDAIQHGHQNGVIHRDLKPGNILVNADGYVKVIDFGIARATDSDVATTTIGTEVGHILGTLQYMSPEQCAADPLRVDIRSDVYSLGVVLYELLCGQPPYDVSGTTITQAARRICELLPIPPRQLQRKLHRLLELLAMKALEKNPSDRYQSVIEFSRDIRHFLNDEPIEAKPPTIWDRAGRSLARHPIAATTAASAFMATLIFLTGYFSLRYTTQTPHDIVVTQDQRSVRLLSYNMTPLDGLDNEHDHAVAFVKYIARTGLEASESLAIVGYTQQADPMHAGTLAVYDITDGRFDQPIWTSRIEDGDAPEVAGDDLQVGDFQPNKVLCVEDIFPAHAGRELVIAFSHSVKSRRVLRIYGMDGKILYEVWHDGVLNSARWLRVPGLLIVAGENAEVYWEDRGYPDLEERYPFIVFALKPAMGERYKNYVRPVPKSGDIKSIWYKTFLPPSAADAVKMPELIDSPFARFKDDRHVGLQIEYKDVSKGSLIWILDDTGLVIERMANDLNTRSRANLSAGEFRLGAMPPRIMSN